MKAAKKTTPGTYHSLVCRINDKQNIAIQIDDVKSKKSSLRSHIQRLERELIPIKQKVNGYSSSVEREHNSDKKCSEYESALRDAEQKLQATQENHDQSERELNELCIQLEALEKKLVACDQDTSINQVLAHQQHIENAEMKVAELQSLIADQEEVGHHASEGKDPLDDLMVEREELLARISLGDAKNDELVNLDKKIAEIDEAFKKNQTQQMEQLRNSRQTVTGLQRRLEDETAELNRLKNMIPQVIEQFLITEAEQTAREYQELAHMLVDKIKRLAALDKMGTDIGHHHGAVFLHHKWKQTFLPMTLIANQNKNLSNNSSVDALFDMQSSAFLVDSEVNQEIERLSQQGVIYPVQQGE